MAASKRPCMLESKESNCELKIAQTRPNDGLHRPGNIYRDKKEQQVHVLISSSKKQGIYPDIQLNLMEYCKLWQCILAAVRCTLFHQCMVFYRYQLLIIKCMHLMNMVFQEQSHRERSCVHSWRFSHCYLHLVQPQYGQLLVEYFGHEKQISIVIA